MAAKVAEEERGDDGEYLGPKELVDYYFFTEFSSSSFFVLPSYLSFA